jgi:hypothetical protein
VKKQYVLHICVCVGVDARMRVCAWARVALIIQNATRMRHLVIYGLFGFGHVSDIIL